MNDVFIIDYEPHLAADFKLLNMAWIEKYFAVEAADEEVLGNPDKNIIQKGGFIFFAKKDGEIAGTFALIREKDDEYELAKMAVGEDYQGKGIGQAMLRFSIDHARKLGAGKLVLFSNTRLQPAIHLYKKFGFTEVPLESSAYQRSNIKMEFDLNANHEQD
jgi:GNAT superfamily N-acetyltransferase